MHDSMATALLVQLGSIYACTRALLLDESAARLVLQRGTCCCKMLCDAFEMNQWCSIEACRTGTGLLRIVTLRD